MKRKFSMLELLLVMSHIGLLYNIYLRQLNKNTDKNLLKQQIILSAFIVFIFALKTKIEGNRWYIIIWFPSFILTILYQIVNLSVEFLYLSAFLEVLHLFLMWYFPFYEIPRVIEITDSTKNNPQCNVSCVSFPIDEQNSSRVTVFYPTEEEVGKGEGDLFMFGPDYWFHLYTTLKENFKIPGFLLDIILSGIRKYKVKVEENHPVMKAQNLKPIIFSHGYAASRTMYSIINRQLASLGYVIFSVEHYDILIDEEYQKEKDKLKQRRKLKQLKEVEIDIRVSKIKDVIDLIHNEKELYKKLGQNMSIDKNSIVLMGHSYGGATAQYASFKYEEKVKAVICLDPWLFVMKDDFLENKLNVPALYINSESFHSVLKLDELAMRNEKIFKNTLQTLKSFNCYIKNMDHIQQGDIGLAIPFEGKLAKLMRYPERTLEFNLYNVKLIELFLKNIVFSKDNQQDLLKADKFEYLNQKIFIPLKRDSYEYFRQEFVQQFDSTKNMYCLDFLGKSPF